MDSSVVVKCVKYECIDLQYTIMNIVCIIHVMMTCFASILSGNLTSVICPASVSAQAGDILTFNI